MLYKTLIAISLMLIISCGSNNDSVGMWGRSTWDSAVWAE